MRPCFASAVASIVFAGTWPSAAGAAESSSAYPVRPVRLIVPFPPGGGTDTVARVVAHKLSESLKQQFVVDNRDGAGSIIGTQIAARAAPDGYTLLFYGNSLWTLPLIREKSFVNYDVERDFVPLTMAIQTPLLLTVHPSLRVNCARSRRPCPAMSQCSRQACSRRRPRHR